MLGLKRSRVTFLARRVFAFLGERKVTVNRGPDTLVRLVLVPATMELLGPANWWLPKWLDRILPKIRIEEGTPTPTPTPTPVPVPTGGASR